MSQLDLIAELRTNRPVAPAELRRRVRALAATAPAPKRRFTWRRALVVGIAVAGLAAVAGVVGTRDGGNRQTVGVVERAAVSPPRIAHEKPAFTASGAAAADAAGTAAPTPLQAQKALSVPPS